MPAGHYEIQRSKEAHKHLRSMMESFPTIVKGWKLLTIVSKLSILGLCGGPGYAYEIPKAFWRKSLCWNHFNAFFKLK